MITASIAEAKDGLSRYIRRAKHGETVVITDRGRPVACLTPIRQSNLPLDSILADLHAEGILTPPQGPPLDPSFFRNRPQTCAPLPYDKSLVAAIIEERQEGDR